MFADLRSASPGPALLISGGRAPRTPAIPAEVADSSRSAEVVGEEGELGGKLGAPEGAVVAAAGHAAIGVHVLS